MIKTNKYKSSGAKGMIRKGKVFYHLTSVSIAF